MRVNKLLTENEHSDIETKTKENRRDGVSALLKALQRRKPGSLKVFIDLLKKVDGSEYLASKLAEALGPGEGRLSVVTCSHVDVLCVIRVGVQLP